MSSISDADTTRIIKAALEGTSEFFYCNDRHTVYDLPKPRTQAKDFAYCPYSNFRVGAALLSKSGDLIKGANVENASYGGTICAERTALVKAVSEGICEFVALAVMTDVHSPISPCGMCRQFIREFCALDMPVLLVPGNYFTESANAATIKIMTVEELLPDSFGPEHLPKK